MMATTHTYSFQYSEQCNMCGSLADRQRILGKRLNRPQGKWPKARIGITTTILRCGVCGLVYPNPLPVPNSIEDHYGIRSEEYWGNEYFCFKESYFANQIKRFQILSGITNRPRALDVGAGIGKCLTALNHAGFEAFGIEPSESFYNQAINKTGIPKTSLRRALIEDAEFPENYFDLITFGAVLEHLYDPAAAIQRALRWLRPNGLMHIEVPSSAWLVNRLGNLFYKLIGTDYVANTSPMHSPYHLYEFSLRSFQMNGQINGYYVVHHQYYVCRPYTTKALAWLLTGTMKITNTGMQLEAWLKKNS